MNGLARRLALLERRLREVTAKPKLTIRLKDFARPAPAAARPAPVDDDRVRCPRLTCGSLVTPGSDRCPGCGSRLHWPGDDDQRLA